MRFWIADAESSDIDTAFTLFKKKSGLNETAASNLEALSPLQREVLKALTSNDAQGAKMFSLATRKSVAAALGMSEPIASAALTRALTEMEKRGLITKISRGEYRALVA
jgi:DNA-binding MarR family transcriptional regulator